MLIKTARPGIYSINGSDPANSGKVVLAVHPFFLKGHHPDYDVAYFERACNFIYSHNGPLVTLEEGKNFYRTASIYRLLGKKHDIYLIKTNSNGPEPAEISWDTMTDFLLSFRGVSRGFRGFAVRPVGLMGGKYFSEAAGGCFWGVKEELISRSVPFEFMEGLVFPFFPGAPLY
jgi:hypothetical protein